jgi:hypothetical protein
MDHAASQSPGGRRRVRFSLAMLLAAVTVCALFLGYAEWRRRWMVAEHAALVAEGVTVPPLSGSWWPQPPPAVLIIFRPSRVRPGTFNQNRSSFTTDEAVLRARDWQARLRRLGVPTVQLSVPAPTAFDVTLLKDAEELREYAVE